MAACGGAEPALLLQWKDDHLANCLTNETWLQDVLVTALQNDGRGGMWIGTSGGQLGAFAERPFHRIPRTSLPRATITSLAVETNGALWVGSVASGVKLIQRRQHAVLSITNGLPGNSSIRALYLDGDGTLWIGTAGGGLSCWRNGQNFSFTADQGIPAHRARKLWKMITVSSGWDAMPAFSR